MALCGPNDAPSPTVPTSIDGIVHVMCKSLVFVIGLSIASIIFIQFELSTFCAGSCPVAIYIAVTILAA
ncbi:3-hydroxy-3-methylglutaryl-coenzyme A reductase [Gigaspora margarita]|uniref:3-hydroxy-3-methylglutaryl-coenzyme A reductase n=1 Tax=Gigaspora margarita TaxID=4874 RepID=A0A8H4EJU2_GIGMA|nr:3-hydroxy-3-methylglutaryl-coenzyme A reductase [Gigaspora margarita]